MPPTRQRSPRTSGDLDWHKKRYPGNPDPPEIEFVRPLYPPDGAEKEKMPSAPGPDVKAIKRAISHAQRFLPWSPEEWDDTYDDVIAHGDGSGIDRSGVAGFQRQMGIEPTGWVGKATFEALRTSLVPSKPGTPQAAKPLFDSECIRLLELAAEQFAESPPDVADVRAAITDFCVKAEANEANWHYSQHRPIEPDVDPSGSSITSDCSGFVIQAYHYAQKTTGLDVPDPGMSNYSGSGNTNTEEGHPKVTDGRYEVGDLAHYDGHVTICRKAGDESRAVWTSHGEEAGPDPRALHYRPLRFVVRPPLLAQDH